MFSKKLRSQREVLYKIFIIKVFKMNKTIGKKEIILKLFKACKNLDEIQAAINLLFIDDSFCSHEVNSYI